MSATNPHPVIVVTGHPVYAMLAQFPVVCFTLTLLFDLAFWQTSNLLWQHFSEWLLLAGLVVGVIAILAAAIGLLIGARRYDLEPVWPSMIGMVLALVLAFFNSLVHAGDGWTAIVPTGLVLSAATVLVLIITGWFHWRATAYRTGETRYARYE